MGLCMPYEGRERKIYIRNTLHTLYVDRDAEDEQGNRKFTRMVVGSWPGCTTADVAQQLATEWGSGSAAQRRGHPLTESAGNAQRAL